jgi:nucleotide-binding universal stress UspA family protein
MALEQALGLADQLGARITLVHVRDRVGSGPEPIFAPPPRPDPASEVDALDAWVRQADEGLPGRVSYLLLSGDPAQEIARLARESRFDLVVMGASRRKGMARLLLGSVEEHVVRRAPCPVLLVRTGST